MSLRDNLGHRTARDLFAGFTRPSSARPASSPSSGTRARAREWARWPSGWSRCSAVWRPSAGFAGWCGGPCRALGLGRGDDFAVSGDLVLYASEAKPYSTDVAAAVACTLAGLTIAATAPVSPWRFAGFMALGAGLSGSRFRRPWCSRASERA